MPGHLVQSRGVAVPSTLLGLGVPGPIIESVLECRVLLISDVRYKKNKKQVLTGSLLDSRTYVLVHSA